jgi:hypothetical protein
MVTKLMIVMIIQIKILVCYTQNGKAQSSGVLSNYNCHIIHIGITLRLQQKYHL